MLDVNEYAFYDYHDVRNVKLEFGGTVKHHAFYNCSRLQTVTISDSENASLGEYAFANNPALKTVTIGKRFKTIGGYAFSNTGATSVTIGDGVQTVGQYAFADSKKLKSVSLGAGQKTYGSYAFSGCAALEDVALGDGTTAISEYMFQNCTSLPGLTIPATVKTVGQYAFSGCSSLAGITVHGGISSIGNGAFNGCKSLADFTAEAGEGTLALGYKTYSSSGTGVGLFADCGLKNVTLERTISYDATQQYGYSPFYGVNTLETVRIGDALPAVLDYEFYNCKGLKTVDIGDGATSIGKYAFSGCVALADFEVGYSIGSIAEEVFSDCTALTSLTCHATAPPACGTEALDDIVKWDCTLHVPDGFADAYTAADQWKEFFFVEGDLNPKYRVSLPDGFVGGHVEGAGVYERGQTASLTAVPYACYYFKEWEDGSTSPAP